MVHPQAVNGVASDIDCTALQVAVAAGNPDVCHMLIQGGADVNMKFSATMNGTVEPTDNLLTSRPFGRYAVASSKHRPSYMRPSVCPVHSRGM